MPDHFNDWPNSQGFDVRHQELEPKELEVTGTIPAYAAGVLFRNGLGPREVLTEKKTTFRVGHWFDNLSQIHRFQIIAPTPSHPQTRVIHNSRLTCDGLIKRIRETGSLKEYTFGAKYDPCTSFFQKLQATFTPALSEAPGNVNINVTLSVNDPGLSATGSPHHASREKDSVEITSLCSKTDNSLIQMLDPQTLQPIGVARQRVLHKDLSGPLSCAHAKVCPLTGDLFNYNLNFGRVGTYRVFTVSAKTGRTSILATICHKPAYLHSFFLTPNYVILCVWNSFFRGNGIPIAWNHNIIDAIADYRTSAQSPATWFVIDRRLPEQGGKGLVATYTSDPFYCFHTINAYEEPDPRDASKMDVVADICAYDNLDVLKQFYIDNLLSDSEAALPYVDPKNKGGKSYFRRFRLADVPSPSSVSSSATKRESRTVETVWAEDKGYAPELPSINPHVTGKKHRYVYGLMASGQSTFIDGIVKFDTLTRTKKVWSVHGQTAGEPIFIPDPDARFNKNRSQPLNGNAAGVEGDDDGEDAGVLLSVVLDGYKGTIYLLALDSKDMTELGRAEVGSVVGFGFHGTWFANSQVQGKVASAA